MERWHGRIALVTGASQGIGFAIVNELVKQGVHVVGCARNTTSLEKLKVSLAENGGKLDVIACDLSKEENILNMFEQIRKTIGHVDVLINNAGVAEAASFIDGKTEDWMKMININVVALSICTREALKLMDKDGILDGHIININSIAGHDIEQTDTDHAYSATKHMVTAITRALDMELKNKKSKIRVTSLSPGLVLTPMTEYIKEENQSRGADYEFLSGKDIADAVIYVLSAPSHVMIRELTIVPTEQPVLL